MLILGVYMNWLLSNRWLHRGLLCFFVCGAQNISAEVNDELVDSAKPVVQDQSSIVNEIVAIVYSIEANEPILLSDLQAGIDGQPKTLKDVVLERLILLDARKYKITVTDEEIDRFLAQLLKQNNWEARRSYPIS